MEIQVELSQAGIEQLERQHDEVDVGGLVKTVVDGVKQRKQVYHFQQSCWKQLGSKDLLQFEHVVAGHYLLLSQLCIVVGEHSTEADHYSYC